MMYKKILALVLLVGSVYSISLVKAEGENVYMQYCSDVDNVTGDNMRRTIMVDGDQNKELCIYFTTSNTSPIQVKYDFTDSHINTHGSQLCDTSTGFSRFFANSISGERMFSVSAEKSQTIKEKIVIPPGMSGMQMGCLAYYIIEQDTMKPGQMFLIRLRKATSLNLFIGSSTSIKSSISLLKNTGGMYSTNSKIKATVDKESNLSVSFLVKNNGNISQNVTISGKIYNFLGFEKPFSFSQKLVAGETKELMGQVGILPAYKGFFTIKYTFQNTPIFDFFVEGLSDKDKIGSTSSDSAQIYIFSWISLIVVLVILLLLIKAFKPKRRQTQTPTQTPTPTTTTQI